MSLKKTNALKKCFKELWGIAVVLCHGSNKGLIFEAVLCHFQSRSRHHEHLGFPLVLCNIQNQELSLLISHLRRLELMFLYNAIGSFSFPYSSEQYNTCHFKILKIEIYLFIYCIQSGFQHYHHHLGFPLVCFNLQSQELSLLRSHLRLVFLYNASGTSPFPYSSIQFVSLKNVKGWDFIYLF